jgi:hypothetical protein
VPKRLDESATFRQPTALHGADTSFSDVTGLILFQRLKEDGNLGRVAVMFIASFYQM